MAIVRVGDREFDVDAVVFDKDDTLVDLNATWGPVARTWITALADGDATLVAVMSERLGYDAALDRVVPDSILATHTLPEIGSHTSALLSAHGIADEAVRERIARARTAIEADVYGVPLEPLTELEPLLAALRAAGLGIGVFTSDDLRPTLHFLESCGIAPLIDVIVTGDQLERPKPHGDGIRRAANALGTSPDRVLMVGDSLHDHDAAREAGAWFVAVGHDTPAGRLADAAVEHVGEITVPG
jgi:phosphoglycolate phosphatase